MLSVGQEVQFHRDFLVAESRSHDQGAVAVRIIGRGKKEGRNCIAAGCSLGRRRQLHGAAMRGHVLGAHRRAGRFDGAYGSAGGGGLYREAVSAADPCREDL